MNIGITCYLDGHHGDCSETYLVTEQPEEKRHSGARRLLEVARRALYVGIDQCGPGRHFSGIGECSGYISELRRYKSLFELQEHNEICYGYRHSASQGCLVYSEQSVTRYRIQVSNVSEYFLPSLLWNGNVFCSFFQLFHTSVQTMYFKEKIFQLDKK